MANSIHSLRVGVAGLGFGASVHVAGLRRIRGVEVCAIAGSDADRAKRAATRLGVPAGVADYRALLEHAPAAVTLALPPDVGARAAEFFISNGIPVLTEKPLAPDQLTAKRLAEASKSLPCAVDFQFRELEPFARAHHAIRGGAIGRIRHLQLTWMMQPVAKRQGNVTWKTDQARAGGVVSLLASHALYLFEWLIGPAVEVFGKLETDGKPWNRGVQAAADTAHLVVSLDSGAVASALVSNNSPGASIHRWEIVGEEGTLLIENPTRDYMAGFRAELKLRNQTVSLCEASGKATEDSRIEPFVKLASRFVECVRTGGRMTPDFEDGWRVQRCIDAVMVSADRHASVAIG